MTAILAAIVPYGAFLVVSCFAVAGPPHDVKGTAQHNSKAKYAIFDSDPQHLWNRLHRAIWIRTAEGGKEFGHDRLDPLLWRESKYLLEGRSHEKVIAILDEFLKTHAEALISDPVKRAILLRDLWSVFDWTTDADAKQGSIPVRSLQTRLARIIHRLALRPQEIKSLPDNYAAAVASRRFATKYDSALADKPFLPPDIFDKNGPWVEVEIDNGSAVTASRHVYDFGARSAFRVFLRFPGGRKATLDYFTRLREYPHSWIANPGPAGSRNMLRLSRSLPQFPVGAQTALVRQMLLIDSNGELAISPITESIQIRVFRAIPALNDGDVPSNDKPGAGERAQDFFEFTLTRTALFAAKDGGLRPLNSKEKDFRTQLLVHSFDQIESPDNVATEKRMQSLVPSSCLGCHDRPGIYSFGSYVGGNYPRPQYYLPILQANEDPETQGRLSAIKKAEQYSWGLLQGLWQEN